MNEEDVERPAVIRRFTFSIEETGDRSAQLITLLSKVMERYSDLTDNERRSVTNWFFLRYP